MKKPRRGTVIFFPPSWLTNFSLLEEFFSHAKKRFENVIIFEKTFSENSFRKMTAPVVGVSYSNGVIDMIDFVSRFPQNFSFTVMIEPTGTREIPPKSKECFSLFAKEISKLIGRKKLKISWEVFRGIAGMFLDNPLGLSQKIEELRQFRLYEKILVRLYGKVDFAFIFSSHDSVVSFQDPPYFIHGRFIIEGRSCGHFGFLEMPGYYWKLFRDL